jgi:tape measure domain-containing protein
MQEESLGSLQLGLSADLPGLRRDLEQANRMAEEMQRQWRQSPASVEIKTDGVYRQIQSLNRMVIRPTVDHAPLVALNRHLSQKEAHWERTLQTFNRPLTPKVDDRALVNLSKQLDRIAGHRQISVGVNADGLSKSIESAIGKGFGSAASIARGSALGLGKIAIAPLKIGINLVSAATGELFKGALQGVGRDLTKSISKSLSGAINDSLADVIGSTDLVGRKIGQGISGAVKRAAISERASSGGGQALQATGSAIRNLVGEKDVAIEANKIRQARYQQEVRDLEQARLGVLQTLRRADIEYERAKKAYSVAARELQPEINQLQGIKTPTPQQAGQLRAVNGILEPREADLIAAKQARSRAIQQLNQLDQEQAPKAYIDLLDKIAPGLPAAQRPRLVREAKKGARGVYNAALNKISLDPKFYDQIASGNVSAEAAYVLAEEIKHGKDFGFGSFEGYVNLRNNRLTTPRVKASKAEEARVAKELAAYDPAVRELERNAKIPAMRAAEEYQRELVAKQISGSAGYSGASLSLLTGAATRKADTKNTTLGQIASEKNVRLPALEKIARDTEKARQKEQQLVSKIIAAQNGQLSLQELNSLRTDIAKHIGSLESIDSRLSKAGQAIPRILANRQRLRTIETEPVTFENIANAGRMVASKAGGALQGFAGMVAPGLAAAGRIASPVIGAARQGYQFLEGIESQVLPFVPMGGAIKSAGKNVGMPMLAMAGVNAMGGGAVTGALTHGIQGVLGMGGDLAASAAAPLINSSMGFMGGGMNALVSGAIEAAVPVVAPIIAGQTVMKATEKVLANIAPNKPLNNKTFSAGQEVGRKAVGAAKDSFAVEYTPLPQGAIKAQLPSAKQEVLMLAEGVDAAVKAPGKKNKRWAEKVRDNITRSYEAIDRAINRGDAAMAQHIAAEIASRSDDAIAEIQSVYQGMKKGSASRESLGKINREIGQKRKAAEDRLKKIELVNDDDEIGGNLYSFKGGLDPTDLTNSRIYSNPVPLYASGSRYPGMMRGRSRRLRSADNRLIPRGYQGNTLTPDQLFGTTPIPDPENNNFAGYDPSQPDPSWPSSLTPDPPPPPRVRNRRRLGELRRRVGYGNGQVSPAMASASQEVGTAEIGILQAQNRLSAAEASVARFEAAAAQVGARVVASGGSNDPSLFGALQGTSTEIAKSRVAGLNPEILAAQSAAQKAKRSMAKYDAAEEAILNPQPPNLLRIAVNKARGAVDDLKGSVKGLVAGGAGLLGLAVGASIIASIGVASTKAASELKSLKLTFDAVTSSKTASDEAFNRSAASANRFGYSLPDSLRADAQFAASVKDSPLELLSSSLGENLRQYGRVVGVSNERMQLSQIALQQSAGKGTLYAEEVFGQLAESLPGGARLLASGSGLSVQQLRKQMEGGGLNAADAIARLSSTLKAESASQAESAAGSAEASIGRLQNSIFSLQAAVGEPLLAPLTAAAQTASGAIDFLSSNMGTIGTVAAISAGVAIAQFVGFGNIITSVAGIAKNAGALIAESFQAPGTAIGKLKGAAMSAASAMAPLASNLGITAGITLAVGAIQTLYNTMNDVAPMKDFADRMAAAAAKIKGSAQEIVKSSDEVRKTKYSKDRTIFEATTDFIAENSPNRLISNGLTALGLPEPSGVYRYKDSTYNIRERDLRQSLKYDVEAEKVLADNLKPVPSDKVEEIAKVNQQLATLRATRKVSSSLDREELAKQAREEQQLINKKSSLEDPIITQKSKIEAQIKSDRAIIEKYSDDDGFANSVSAARRRIALNEAGIAELDSTLGKVTDSTTRARQALEQLSSELGTTTTRIQRQRTQQTTLISERTSINPLDTGGKIGEIFRANQNALNNEIDAIRTALAKVKTVLATPEIATEVAKFQKEGKLPQNIADTTPEQIAALEKVNASSEFIESVKSLIKLTQLLESKIPEKQQQIEEYRRSIVENAKAAQDYYRNAVDGFNLASIDTQIAKQSMVSQDLTGRYKSALLGFGSSLTNYLDGMTDAMSELRQAMNIELERKKKDLQLQIDKINAEREYQNQVNSYTKPNISPTMAPPGAASGVSSPIANGSPQSVVVNRTGTRNELGLENLDVKVYGSNGELISRQTAHSGSPRNQRFGGPGQTASGSAAPMEFGRYRIGREVPGADLNAVGRVFIPFDPTFPTQRRAIGGHLDANRAFSPGSAGCLVFESRAEFEKFRAALKASGATQLDFSDAIQAPESIRSAPQSSNGLNYRPVTSTFYTPGEGNIALNGGKVDMRGRYIDSNSLVMATRTTGKPGGIPYGSMAELRNGDKTVMVKVVDQGGLQKGTDIDVTPGVARRLGIVADGFAKLEMRLVDSSRSINNIDLGVGTNRLGQWRPAGARPATPGVLPIPRVRGRSSAGGNIPTVGPLGGALNENLIPGTPYNLRAEPYSAPGSGSTPEENLRLAGEAYRETQKMIDEQRKINDQQAATSKRNADRAIRDRARKLERDRIVGERTDADKQQNLKRQAERDRDKLGFDTPEKQQRIEARNQRFDAEDRALLLTREAEDLKTQIQLVSDWEKEVAATPVEQLSPQEQIAIKKMREVVAKSMPVLKKRLAEISGKGGLIEQAESTSRALQADADRKFRIGAEDRATQADAARRQQQIASLVEKKKQADEYMSVNPFDTTTKGDPLEIQRQIDRLGVINTYSNTMASIRKSQREDPTNSAKFSEQQKLADEAYRQGLINADSAYTSAFIKRMIDFRKKGESLTRSEENAKANLLSASAALSRARGETFYAEAEDDRIAKLRAKQATEDERRSNQDLFDRGEISSTEFAKRYQYSRSTYELNTKAIDVAAEKRLQNNRFNLSQGAAQGTIDRIQAAGDYQGLYGNSFDSQSSSREAAILAQRRSMAAKIKELNELAAANPDEESAGYIKTMREELEKLSQIQLDKINLQFSNFRGIIDETNSAFKGFLGSVTEGKGNLGQSLLNLVIAPFKGLKAGLDNYLASQFSGWVEGLMAPVTKQLDAKAGTAVKAGSSGGGFNWFGAGLSLVTGLLGFADGGIIGTGKSSRDDTMIMAMRGEGVLTHRGVEAVGGERGLKLLNSGLKLSDLPRFANGGIVGASTTSISNLSPVSNSQANYFNSSISFEGSNVSESSGNSDTVRKAMEGAMVEVILKLQRQGVI